LVEQENINSTNVNVKIFFILINLLLIILKHKVFYYKSQIPEVTEEDMPVD